MKKCRWTSQQNSYKRDISGGKIKRKKRYTGAMALVCIGVLCLLQAKEYQAKDSGLYIAGSGNAYPLEYCDKASEGYKGVLPRMVEEASRISGIRVTYVSPSKKDGRSQQVKGLQVDLVFTGQTGEEEDFLEDVTADATILEYWDGKQESDVRINHTKAANTKQTEAFVEALESIDQKTINGYFLETAQGERSKRWPLVTLAAVAGILLVAMAAGWYRSRRYRKQKERLVYEDPLTGHENMKRWEEKYREYIQDGNREHYAVLWMHTGVEDISRIYGYKKGRDITKLVAEGCRGCVNPQCEAYVRYNEFDFVFFIQYVTDRSIEERIQQIYENINSQLMAEKSKIFLKLYTGIYKLNQMNIWPEDSLQMAEVAMIYACDNQLELTYYSDTVEQAATKGYMIEHGAQHGLLNQEFEMYLQPIVRSTSGEIEAAEALVRWNNPEKGLMKPGDFISVIKNRKLISKINLDIFEQGCRFLREQNEAGHKLRILFNFSEDNFREKSFAEHLAETAADYQVSPDQIILQMNHMQELVKMEEFESAAKKLQESGFELCMAGLELDNVFFDFLEMGTTSMKLRKEFLDQINNEKGQMVLHSVIQMCKNLGMKIYCVGVENKEQMAFLLEMGCTLVSGYYISPPVNQLVMASMLKDKLL